jgi:two-component system sensor histidine kinase CreC
MSLRTRLLLSFTAIVALGFYLLTDWFLAELRPRYLEAVEEALVDQAYVLAALVEKDLAGPAGPFTDLRQAIARVSQRSIDARIFSVTKTGVDIRIYITDARGTVVYDSSGQDEGQDYRDWLNVKRTLLGKYGARTSHETRFQAEDSVLHVTAPLLRDGRIAGTLTVAKPTTSINRFITSARPQWIIGFTLAAVSVVGLTALLSLWITGPLRDLRDYALAVRDHKPARLPRSGATEIAALAQAFEQMRVALEGKEYIEHYVQTLTHALKGPLAAVRSAAELLGEPMPDTERQRFAANIRHETGRMQDLIDRMLMLSGLEAQNRLAKSERVPLDPIITALATSYQPRCAVAQLTLTTAIQGPASVKGDPVLLQEAGANLLENALEFSPPGGGIRLACERRGPSWEIIVTDDGPGIPDFALPRLFERFYSLARPVSGRKGGGLGLVLVREIMRLHGGEVTLANRTDGRGARAVLRLPAA